MRTAPETTGSKVAGALLGIQIGDALAMPAHWYYDRTALQRDYGLITDFVVPKSPHPDSILWRSKWHPPSPDLDILGDQRPFWGQRGVHYHQNLAAGESTLTGKLAAGLWHSINARGGFDVGDSLRFYIDLLTHPGRHRDTYLEECHRGFFTNLGLGTAPAKCAVEEKHIGGLTPMLAAALYYPDQAELGREMALEQLALTHAGQRMKIAADAVLTLLYRVLDGESLEQAILAECQLQHNPHFGFPYSKLLKKADRVVVGRHFSTACYVDGAVPAVIYL
ncbi:MAG: ADP-ribosylglycohydrolase family protein, partial [Verrucomicrobiales bacterium]